MWIRFASLVLLLPALKCSRLLLLKQRLRLEELFHYEVSECISSAEQLSANLWTAPAQASFIDDGSVQAKHLTSVRSVMDIVTFGKNPKELVDNVRDMKISQPLPWSIEYECLAPLEDATLKIIDQYNIEARPPICPLETIDDKSKKSSQISAAKSSEMAVDRKSFSSKTLFCAISQCIQGPPALDPREALVFYYLLEAKEGFYLGLASEPLNPTVPKQSNSAEHTATPSIKELWAGRPFIFSAALNIEIAEAVVNILQAKLRAKQGGSDTVFTILDPCCGSGTTLFAARRLGFRAIGSDVNAMFVAGAERNLNYAGLIPQIEIEETVSAFSNRDSAGIFAPPPPVDDDAAATDGSIAPSSLSSSAHSHSDAMLQLYTKDASCSLSAWKPYKGEIDMKKISDLENEKEKVVLKETKVLYRENREGEAEVLAVAATAAKLEEEEIEDEVTAPAQTSAAIPTEGRTKRFLQSSKVTRSSGMSLNADPYAPWGIVDCVFCNFPWGENIFEYFNETEDILTALGKQLNSGCECAFVTKELLPENVLRERGFSLRDVIPIRDEKKKDRAVPYSKKNKNSNSNSNSAFENQIAGHTGDCFISFAVVV